jgi:hypothetical protein
MGIRFSRPVQQPKIVDVVINIPQVTDELEPADLRRLARVNRDLNRAVDHPAVWRAQFAKILAVRPKDLPEPGQYTPGAANPFKMLCRGVFTSRHVAATRQNPTTADSAMMGIVHGYLHEHFPESSAVLTEIVNQLTMLEEMGKLPPEFWTNLAFDAGLTTVSAGHTAMGVAIMAKVPAHVAAPMTVKAAGMVKVLGAKWAKVYLYSVCGISVMTGLLGVGVGGYMTVDTLLHAKQHYEYRKRRMRDLRIKDLVSERRAIQQ